MAETIFNRISRVLTATVEDSVDRLEKAGGEQVMRQAIREAERAIDQVKAERDAALTRRLLAVRQQGLTAKRIESLGEKARFAVKSERDELAEAALSQQMDLETQSEHLTAVQAQVREEEARIAEGLTALLARKAQMEETLAAYLSARRDASDHGTGLRPAAAAERRVDAAERAFERAMAGADGVALTRVSAEVFNRVAEIDSLQRGAKLAERLEALKQQGGAR